MMVLLQSWGGRENGFGLAEFCRDLPLSVSINIRFPHFDYCGFILHDILMLSILV